MIELSIRQGGGVHGRERPRSALQCASLGVWCVRPTEGAIESGFSLQVSSTADIVPRLLSAFLFVISFGGLVHLAVFSLMYPDVGRKILHPFPNGYCTSHPAPLLLPPLLPKIMCFVRGPLSFP